MKAFADLGLIFLMFFVGLNLDFTDIKKAKRSSIYVAIFSALVPFILGYFSIIILNAKNIIHVSHPSLVGLIIGGILSVTGETVSIDLLKHTQSLKSKLAKTIMTADLYDNIIEAVLISFLVTFIHFLKDPMYGVLIIIFDLIIFFVLVYAAGFMMLPFVIKFLSKDQPKIDLFIISLILSLFMAIASEYLGIGSILGALLAGMIMKYSLVKSPHGKRLQKQVTEVIEITTFGFIAPFFFIWVGMQGNFSFLIINPWLGIVITLAALIAKPLGSLIGEWLAKGDLIEGITAGWGMNTRGAIELVAAELARQNNLITHELFSALVFMAFFTTIISPMFFRFYIDRYYKNGNRKTA